MRVRKRAKPTPSSVSDQVATILASEVRAMRRRQRAGALDPEEIPRLLQIGRAMKELEESRLGAVVSILGARFRHKDIPDDVLNPLLDAMTGTPPADPEPK